MKYFLSIILAILIFSCTTTKKDEISTYFGGEIINPKSDFVLFLKDNIVIDSLPLDENNRFLKSYSNLQEGLYTFKHGNEFQYVYLEPADSVLVRLNTWDFDESLVFSGKGSSKNEFLINLFLQNEKEEYDMYRYFKMSEQSFDEKIDSLTNVRVAIYNDFANTQTQLTDGFIKLTNTAIHFPLYRLKEAYPYKYKAAYRLKSYPKVSNNFYNYRKDINLNEKELVSFSPYQNYVIYYLYNISSHLKETDSTKNNLTINVLNAIIDNIQLEDFKNSLLKKVVVNDFFENGATCGINEQSLNLFLENCTNEKEITIVKNLVNDSKIILKDQPLANFEIATYTNELTSIQDVIKNKKAVIYFWSLQHMSSDYLIKRIKYLEKKHPNVLFIGVNMQDLSKTFETEQILKSLDTTKQFKLTKESFAHNYLTSKYPRVIIVNNEAIVKNGFTFITSYKLSSELNKLK